MTSDRPDNGQKNVSHVRLLPRSGYYCTPLCLKIDARELRTTHASARGTRSIVRAYFNSCHSPFSTCTSTRRALIDAVVVCSALML